MSRANLYVRFPDGTVRYGLYNNTSETVYGSRLFDHPDQAWSAHLDKLPIAWWPDPEGPVVDVEVASDCGDGYHWPGKAAVNSLEDGFSPWDEDAAHREDGLPLWAVWPEDVVDGGVVRRELGMAP